MQGKGPVRTVGRLGKMARRAHVGNYMHACNYMHIACNVGINPDHRDGPFGPIWQPTWGPHKQASLACGPQVNGRFA